MSVHIFNKFMLFSPFINIYSLQNLDVEINELVQNLYLATVYRSKGHFAVALNANKAKKRKHATSIARHLSKRMSQIACSYMQWFLSVPIT